MKTFKALTLALLLACGVADASAQVTASQQAGLLADHCLQYLRNTGDSADRVDCAMRVSTYVAGWRAGVVRGLGSAIIAASPNESSEEGWKKLQLMRPSALCFPVSGKNARQFIAGFVDFVAAKPSRQAEDYADVLEEYIGVEICNAR